MFQINEKSIADNRTLITVNDKKSNIKAVSKNGTINYSMDDHALWLTTPKIRQAFINQELYQDFFDRIVIARNGVDIDGAFSFDDNINFKKNVEIKQNIIVRGDMLVEGNSSIIDTPNLSIEDNIIELNRNEKSNGILLNSAGIAINRGTKPFARYLYSENYKAFVLDTASTIDASVSNPLLKVYSEDNGENVAGQVSILKKLTVPTAIIDNLTVNQNTNLNSLIVNGSATLKKDVSIEGILTAKNNVTIQQNLTVNENAFFKKNATISNSLTAEGNSFFNSLATFNQGVLIKNGLTVSSGGANITGNSNISGTLTVTDNVVLNKNLNVTETTTSKNANVSSQLTTYNALINNNLQAKGPVTIDGTLTSNNSVTLNGSNLTVNSLTDITKDTTISGSNLTITTKSDGSSGNLYVKGNTEISKNLIISGSINSSGSTTVNSNLTANNILSKTNVSLASGNNNGFRFWDSDNYKIYMTATGDSNGGSVSGASASDYNMYFKMTGGTNRGFVFKNDANNLVQIESTGILRAINDIYAKGSKVLRHADMGHQPANNTPINACMIDGKHYTDLVNQFVDVAGDTMTGKLIMNNSIDMTSENPITFNSRVNSYIKSFGTNKDDLLMSSTNRIYFYPAGTSSKEMILKEDGNLSVLGSNVLRQADEGHGKGIDADTVDGYHLNQNVLTTSSPTFYDLNLNRRVAGTKTTGSIFTDGQNTSKTYLNFVQASGSNASGKIYHESSSYSSDINKGIIHLCPSVSNDNSLNYVSIHGSNSAESIKLYTGGNIYAPGTITAPTFSGSLSGNASSATKLQTARTINGTNFDGTANITTSYWGTARTFTLGRTAKSVNGSANISWTLDEIGALDKYNDSTLATGKKILLGSTGAYILSGASPEFVTNTNIIIKADADASTTTEYTSIKAGHNELKITSSGGGTTVTQGQDKLTFNGNIVYHAGRKPTPSEVGAVSKSGDTMTGRLTANGKISIPTTGSSWISGMTLNNASIAISTQQTTSSYHPVLAVKTSGNHVANIGGLGDDFGFYGYKSGRTDNGTDWHFKINASTGNVASTGVITAPTFSGALSGNASTATILQTARTLTIGNTGKNFNGSANVSWSLSEIGAFGKQGEVSATTNWNNLRTPGVYKVQMSAWGDASLGGPNNFSSSLYCYGMLHVYQSNVASEERTTQIYYPHNTSNSHPIIIRMYNGSAWTAWSKIGRGLTYSDVGAAASSHTHNYLPLSGGTMTGSIKYSSGSWTGNAIALEPGSDSYGAYIGIGAGGLTIIGSGESTSTVRANVTDGSQETMIVASDVDIQFITGVQDSYSNKKVVSITNTGVLQAPQGITGNLSGNASTATKLQTARSITIGNTTKSFDGSGNVSWSLSEIGAAISSGSTNINTLGSIIKLGSGGGTVGIQQNEGNWWQRLYIQDTEDKSVKRLLFSERQGSGDYIELFGVDGYGEIYAKGQKVYHTGNKPTPADIGAAASSHTHSYLPLSGGTMSSNINFGTTKTGIFWSMNTDGAGISFKNDSDGDTDSYLEFNTRDNNNEYFKFTHTPSGGTTTEWMSLKSDGLRVKGNMVYHTGNKPTPSDIGAATSSHTHNHIISPSGRIADANIPAIGDKGIRMYLATSSMTANKPRSDGYILNFDWDHTGGWNSQLFLADGPSPVIQMRGMNEGTWGAWHTVYSTNNKPTPADIGAATSSHTHSYLPLSGGTLTGALTISGHNGTKANGKRIFWYHDNQNVTISAAGASGDLYLGYNAGEDYQTRSVRLESQMTWKGGNVLIDSNGNIPWARISGKPFGSTTATFTAGTPNQTWANSSIKSNDILFGADFSGHSTTDANIVFSSQKGKMNIVIDGEFYAKEGQYKVYHAGNKPTPADVGALSTSGGTVKWLNVEGYYTSSTSGTYANQWTKIVSTTITTRYHDSSIICDFIDSGSGQAAPLCGRLYFRVKQQNALGESPSVYLGLMNYISTSPDNFKAVVTSNTTTQTTVELWFKNNVSYTSVSFIPVKNAGIAMTYYSSQSYSTSLPTGTQISCSKIINHSPADIGSYTKAEVDTKINNAIVVSSSAPSSPVTNQVWIDTTNGVIKYYSGSAWIALGAVYK